MHSWSTTISAPSSFSPESGSKVRLQNSSCSASDAKGCSEYALVVGAGAPPALMGLLPLPGGAMPC